MSATTGPDADLHELFEPHRRELTGFCYRMLGAAPAAEAAVQETMVRAWRAADRFEGRSSLRTWLYRIASNVCTDMHRSPQRRARPMDLGPSTRVSNAVLGDPSPENTFVLPVLDEAVIGVEPVGVAPVGGDPAAVAAARESIRLAFVAALQHLPPRQRAVLILCEVLRWSAAEVAELLETSVASVNSALQRARATMAGLHSEPLDPVLTPGQEELLAAYVDAFERYDMTALAMLLRDDVVLSMPPWDLWLQGPDEAVAWMLGPGAECRGSRLVPVALNGTAGFGSYRRAGSGRWEPWSLQVIEVREGRIAAQHNFLASVPGATIRFTDYGLPAVLED